MSNLHNTNPIKTVLVFCLLTVCWLASATAAFGQSSTSAINGVVNDPVGAVVPGAKVTLRNVDTNVVRTTVSNSGGDYFFSSVPPARYILTFSAPSFPTATISPLEVALAPTMTVTAALRVGCGSPSVTRAAAW